MTNTYDLLRTLTTPIVAVTTNHAGKLNGMIANSAVRASLSNVKPRVSVYIHKFNYSHELIFDSGRFALHVLDENQMDVVAALGFPLAGRMTSCPASTTRSARWTCLSYRAAFVTLSVGS